MGDDGIPLAGFLYASAQAKPGWWQEYSDIVPETVEIFAEIGEDAATAHSYDNVYVQGCCRPGPTLKR